jgi:tetratricopeptide (TPR) repeat protein
MEVVKIGQKSHVHFGLSDANITSKKLTPTTTRVQHPMRIQRNHSRLSFRKQQRRRRSGCLSWAVFLGLLAGVAGLSWSWLGTRLNFATSHPSTEGMIAAANAAFGRGDLETAIGLARQVLDAAPDQTEVLVLLARSLVYRSYADYNHAADRQAALELTRDALTNDPNNPTLLAGHAYTLQAAGQPIEAARYAQEALKQKPDDGLARVALALAYGGVGSFEVALRESMQAANGDWQLEGLRAMAISYSDLGDYRSAVDSIEKALKLNNYLLPLYFERALYAMQLGDADAATAAYFQVLTYDPPNVKARLRLCELSSLMREHDAAVDYCQQVTERAPSWADGWYQLGLEYFLQGDFPSAQSALHRCSSLQIMQNIPVSERRFECWYLQGQAAEILGDCPSLLTTYNEFRAMAADPSIQQTWTYPPEGPPGCSAPATVSTH